MRVILLGGIRVKGDEANELVSRLRQATGAAPLTAADKIEAAVARTGFDDLDDSESDELLAVMDQWLADVGEGGWRQDIVELHDQLHEDARRRGTR